MDKKISFLSLLFFFSLISCSKQVLPIKQNTDIIDIRDFGAIADDGKDDSDAIQQAVNTALNSGKSSHIYISPGIYDLQKGIVVARLDGAGQMQFVTLTISGHVSAYSSDQRIGKTSVLRLKNPGFGIALQKARNCVIENIVFEGCATYSTDPEKIYNWKDDDWGMKNKAITNPYSPSCAIVIDPFHSNVPAADRYKGYGSCYSYSSNGGSSMVLIRGCAFFNHYIAIANNPSNGVQNGDNIRAEQCHVSTCHTFWSAGQTQSRANSIDNIYALFLHTLVSGVQIGNKQGTSPVVTNLNLAGFCKMVFNIRTGFSGLNVYRSYMESIWSLGISNGISTSFDQCQFKFHKPDSRIPAPPFHLYADRVVALRDCSIAYFDNCNSPIPFLFRSKELIVSGGNIEGGVIVADGITNAGGDDLHKVQLDGVFIQCLGKVAGKQATQKPDSKVKNEIIMGGEVVMTSEGNLYVNQGSTYSIRFCEVAPVSKGSSGSELVLKSSNTKLYTKGDNLFSDAMVDAKETGLSETAVRTFLGYVSDVKPGEVIIKGFPDGIAGKKHKVYIVAYPQLSNENSGKNQISEVIQFKKSPGR